MAIVLTAHEKSLWLFSIKSSSWGSELKNSLIDHCPLCSCGSTAHIKLSRLSSPPPQTHTSPPHHSHIDSPPPYIFFSWTFPQPDVTWAPLCTAANSWQLHMKVAPMPCRSSHNNRGLTPFPLGFIWLECFFFYLELTDRASSFYIPYLLWTRGSSLSWGPNAGHQKGFLKTRSRSPVCLRLIPLQMVLKRQSGFSPA